MSAEAFTIEGPEEIAVAGHRYHTQSDTNGIVVIGHGMAEHSASYIQFAETLQAAGYSVYLFDQLGHGRTRGGTSFLGHLADHDGWRKAVEVLDRIVKLAQEQNPGVPVVVLGQSMGSVLAQAWLVEHSASCDGVILLGTQASPGFLGPLVWPLAGLSALHYGWRGRNRLLNDLILGGWNRPYRPARTPYDWLTRDGEVVDAYETDPLCGAIHSTRFWLDMARAVSFAARPANRGRIRLDLPIALLNGDHDSANQNGRRIGWLADQYRRRYGIRDVTFKIWRGARHHLLNETNRDEVQAFIVRWLNRCCHGS